MCVLCCSDSESVQDSDGATNDSSESEGDTNSEADSDSEVSRMAHRVNIQPLSQVI